MLYGKLCFGETVVQRCSVKKGDLRNFAKFTGKHLCHSLFFNKVILPEACNFNKKDSGTGFQVKSEIFKKTFVHRTPLVAASFPRIWKNYLVAKVPSQSSS